MIAEALRLHKAGFRVIPTSDPNTPDGKKPLCSWKKYQENQTEQDIKDLFSMPNVGGMALLTGNGIEVIDVDLKYALSTEFEISFFDALIDGIGFDCYDRLVLSKTISGGYHLIYRTDISEGNQKLASRFTKDDEKKNQHDKVRVLLETRGKGGYILIPPTNGYSYDNKVKDITTIPTITDWQREAIINICKSFDETNEIFKKKATAPVEITEHKGTIEAFNESHSPIELIEAAGWQYKYTRGDNDYYIRPGKDLKEGIGAGYSNSQKLLYVFTSSTEFEPNKAYNAFQTYSYLNHSGDYSAACKELYHNDYGDRLTTKQQQPKQIEQPKDVSKMESIFNKRFRLANVPPKVNYNLFCYDGYSGNMLPFASFGDIVTITGAAKSRKTAITKAISAALLQDGINYNRILNFEGLLYKRNIICLDTEQNEPDFYKAEKQMLAMAGIDNDPKNLYSYCLTDVPLKDRLDFVEYVMNRVGNVGVLVLDGIVDICKDYNSQEESRLLIDHLKVLIAKHNTLFIPVLHTARSTGSARGHLGNELINKSKAVINVTKNDESGTSTVKFDYLRGNREPSTFDIWHDDNGNLIHN